MAAFGRCAELVGDLEGGLAGAMSELFESVADAEVGTRHADGADGPAVLGYEKYREQEERRPSAPTIATATQAPNSSFSRSSTA